eukprot:764244-Hanusia_phi.AAC.1
MMTQSPLGAAVTLGATGAKDHGTRRCGDFCFSIETSTRLIGFPGLRVGRLRMSRESENEIIAVRESEKQMKEKKAMEVVLASRSYLNMRASTSWHTAQSRRLRLYPC